METIDDVKVRIGDIPEFAYLTQEQWKLLVGSILDNKPSNFN